MAENYYLDDGTYSASQIIIALVQRALEVIAVSWQLLMRWTVTLAVCIYTC